MLIYKKRRDCRDVVDIQTIELDGNRCQRECYGLIGWNTYRKGNIYKF